MNSERDAGFSDGDGGAISNLGALTLDHTTHEIVAQGVLFQNNECLQSLCPGGGLGAATLTLTDTQVIHNAATGQGGGAWAQNAATLSGGLTQDNRCRATGCNGGRTYSAGSVALSGTAILSSTSGFDGGSIGVGGPVTLTDSPLQRNACAQVGCSGGRLLTQSSADLTRPRFAGNSASSRGGGASTGNATVRDGLFQDNRCQTGGCRAGGLYAGGSAFEDYNLFFGVPAHAAVGAASGGHSFKGNPVFADAAHDDDHLWIGSAAFGQGVDVGMAFEVDGDPRSLHSGFDEFNLRLVYMALVRK